MIQPMACGRCKQPRCHLCHLFDTNASYRAMWQPCCQGQGEPVPVATAAPAAKPRVDITELAAKRRRCGEAKAAGRPCTEFAATPAPATSTEPAPMPALKWAYGVTTCTARRDTLLPRTLASLAAGGFPSPRLFVDGAQDASEYTRRWGVEITFRNPPVRTYGNWILALAELFIRTPHADRYAMFQDDFVCYRNLRAYLEACPYQPKTYLNLYTFPENADKGRSTGVTSGWFESNQRGKGAVALVFDREAVLALLSHQDMIMRPLSATRSQTNVDGGVVTALRKVGYKELCHLPSLVQHTGIDTSMREFDPRHKPQPLADTFRGEQFDALGLLKESGRLPSHVGAAAYDTFEEPLRSVLVSEWHAELTAIRQAIAADEVRERQATGYDRMKYTKAIADYRQRIAYVERNSPPYFTAERRRELAKMKVAIAV